MKRHKHKKARLLTMDELHARPCEVNGRPALFHRWVEESQVLLNFNCYMNEHDRDLVLRDFHAHKFTPAGVSSEAVHHTFALVEYQDGTVAKVEPEQIHFIKKEKVKE